MHLIPSLCVLTKSCRCSNCQRTVLPVDLDPGEGLAAVARSSTPDRADSWDTPDAVDRTPARVRGSDAPLSPGSARSAVSQAFQSGRRDGRIAAAALPVAAGPVAGPIAGPMTPPEPDVPELSSASSAKLERPVPATAGGASESLLDEDTRRRVQMTRSFTKLGEKTSLPAPAGPELAGRGAANGVANGVFSRSLDRAQGPVPVSTALVSSRIEGIEGPRRSPSGIPVPRNRSAKPRASRAPLASAPQADIAPTSEADSDNGDGAAPPKPQDFGLAQPADAQPSHAPAEVADRQMSLPHAAPRAPDGFTEEASPEQDMIGSAGAVDIPQAAQIDADPKERGFVGWFLHWFLALHRSHHWIVHLEWASLLAVCLYQFPGTTMELTSSPHVDELRAQLHDQQARLQANSEREEDLRAQAALLAIENDELKWRHRRQTAFDVVAIGSVILLILASRQGTAAAGDGSRRCDAVRQIAARLISVCAFVGRQLQQFLGRTWLVRIGAVICFYAVVFASGRTRAYLLSFCVAAGCAALFSRQTGGATVLQPLEELADVEAPSNISPFNRRVLRAHNINTEANTLPLGHDTTGSPMRPGPPAGLGLLVTPPRRLARKTPRKPGLSATRRAVDAVIATRVLGRLHGTPFSLRGAPSVEPKPEPELELEPEPEPEPEDEDDDDDMSEEYGFAHDPRSATLVVGAASLAQHMTATVAQFGLQTPRHLECTGLATSPPLADGPLLNTNELRGKVAIVKRGASTFVDKARRAQAAGVVGVIIVNTDDEPYVPLAGTPTRGRASPGADISVPVICVRKVDGDIIDAMCAISSDGTVPISLSYPGHALVAASPAEVSSSPPTSGTLTVTIIKCRQLISCNHDQLSDPFLTLWLGDRQLGTMRPIDRIKSGIDQKLASKFRRSPAGPSPVKGENSSQMQRSSTRYKDVDPEFQERFTFSMETGLPDSSYVLQCVVQDASSDNRPMWKGGRNKEKPFLGELSVDLSEAFDEWNFQSVELIREFTDSEGKVDPDHLKDRLLQISHQAMRASDDVAALNLGPYGSVHMQLEFRPTAAAAAAADHSDTSARKLWAGPDSDRESQTRLNFGGASLPATLSVRSEDPAPEPEPSPGLGSGDLRVQDLERQIAAKPEPEPAAADPLAAEQREAPPARPARSSRGAPGRPADAAPAPLSPAIEPASTSCTDCGSTGPGHVDEHGDQFCEECWEAFEAAAEEGEEGEEEKEQKPVVATPTQQIEAKMREWLGDVPTGQSHRGKKRGSPTLTSPFGACTAAQGS